MSVGCLFSFTPSVLGHDVKLPAVFIVRDQHGKLAEG